MNRYSRVFLVTTDHENPEYGLDRFEIVAYSKDDGQTWFALGRKLGSVSACDSPRAAVSKLMEALSYTNVQMVSCLMEGIQCQSE